MSSIVEDWECTECKDGKGFQEHFNDSEEGHIFECLKCKYMEVYREDVDTGKIVEDYVGYEHEYNNQQANKQRGQKKKYISKQKEYKKAIEILKEVFERKKDNILDNPKDKLFKQHLESLRCSIELIEDDIPYLNPNY